MSQAPRIGQDFENSFTHKFNVNRPTLAVMIRPGGKGGGSSHIRLQILGRPRSPHGKVQGDHTLAWGAISRSLEWLFEDVTLVEAVGNIKLLHKSLCIAFLSSYSSCYKQMDTSMIIHDWITSGKCPTAVLTSWITEYLMHYCHIRNAQPEASVVLPEKSGGKGEAKALKNLKNLETKLMTNKGASSPDAMKEEAVQALAILIDKRAIQGFIDEFCVENRSRSLQRILTFQLVGIHEVLQSLPNISKLLLSGLRGLNLLSAGKQKVPDELLSHLAQVILYPQGYKPSAGEHQTNKAKIQEALAWIAESAVEGKREVEMLETIYS